MPKSVQKQVSNASQKSWNALASIPRSRIILDMGSSGLVGLLGLIMVVLGVSFMFRTLGLLTRIAREIEGLRTDLRQQEHEAPPLPLSQPSEKDRNKGKDVDRKKTAQSEALKFHFGSRE